MIWVDFSEIKPENALEECNRFLKPLEEFASDRIETHILAIEVYSRKNKFLLMLKFLKKLKNFNATLEEKAKFHYYLCKFLLKCKCFILDKIKKQLFEWSIKLLDNEAKAGLNEVLVNVIESELTSTFFQDDAIKSVEELNKKFFTEHSSNYLCVIEAAKLIYDLNPSSNQKQALELITNLDTTKYEGLNLKVLIWRA